MERITIVESPIEDAVAVNRTVTEFESPYNTVHFNQRIFGKPHLILVGQVNEVSAGYLVSYEDRHYPSSFYVWMAGVNSKFRKKGVLKAMMQYQENWAKEKGYKKLVLKTRNSRREMLSYLIAHGYNFVEVIPKEKIEDTEILAEKIIE